MGIITLLFSGKVKCLFQSISFFLYLFVRPPSSFVRKRKTPETDSTHGTNGDGNGKKSNCSTTNGDTNGMNVHCSASGNSEMQTE